MPSQISPGVFRARVPELELEPLQMAVPSSLASYPLNNLLTSKNTVDRAFDSVKLGNGDVEVEVLPDLGGMTVSIRSAGMLNTFGDELLFVAGGRRGADVRNGLHWLVGEERTLALAPIRYQVREPEDEESDAAIVFFERIPDLPISWHGSISIAAEGDAVRYAMQAFNRSFSVCHVPIGLRIGDEKHIIEDRVLIPRETVSWEVEFRSGQLDFERANHPESDFRRDALKYWSMSERGTSAEVRYIHSLKQFESGELDMAGIQSGERVPGFRASSLQAQAIVHASNRDFKSALGLARDSLTFNAEDPLAWWLVAALSRKLEQDTSMIENAHYLAPLEPMLRAEAFLSQPNSMSSDANPLVKPFANDPDAMIEVACLLMQCGFFDDLSRWTDECLRHRDVPMLRYLLAFAYRLSNSMPVEVATEVARAAKSPLVPPFPNRNMELRAIADLRLIFPKDERLELLHQIAIAGNAARAS